MNTVRPVSIAVLRRVLTMLAALVLSVTVAAAYDDSGWYTGFGTPPPIPGANYEVYRVLEWNGSIYAGGAFTMIDGTAANHVARWTGTGWEALGAGVNGAVRGLAAYGGCLVAAGDFTTAGGIPASGIARWDGANWLPLGSGIDVSGSDQVLYLKVFAGDLIACGHFASAGGVPVHNIARWDGTAWFPLALGVTDEAVAMEIYDGELVVAGSFGQPGRYLARWNGSFWSQFSVQLDAGQIVRSLGVWNNKLIVGGQLGYVGGVYLCDNILSWNGVNWEGVGTGIHWGGSPMVRDLATWGGDLIAVGNFPSAGDVEASNVARWDGSAWSAMGLGLGSPDSGTSGGQSVAPSASGLIVGGSFPHAGTGGAPNIVRWTGDDWTALPCQHTGGAGVSDGVCALAGHDGRVFAGGSFEWAGDQYAGLVCEWDDRDWRPYGSGIEGWGPLSASDSCVAAVATFRGSPAATFHNVSPGCQVRYWNGSEWTAIGSGDPYSSQLRALAVYNDELYLGGNFTSFGGATGSKVVAWNGTSWRAVGALSTDVQALAVHAGKLYASDLLDIYELSGSGSWVTIGQPNQRARALASYSSCLAAGGDFSSIDGVPASGVALWNGSTWSALGSGVQGSVWALTSHQGRLAAGGTFTQAGGQPASRIALWDGAAWNALGSGVNGTVRALCSLNSRLYIGGHFTQAGTVASLRMARWDGLTPAAVSESSASTTIAVHMQNPYVPGGPIRLMGARAASAEIRLYDVAGNLVRRWSSAARPDGSGAFNWDGRDGAGAQVPSGLYFLRTASGSGQRDLKFVLVRP